jgi:hypothetical protein
MESSPWYTGYSIRFGWQTGGSSFGGVTEKNMAAPLEAQSFSSRIGIFPLSQTGCYFSYET